MVRWGDGEVPEITFCSCRVRVAAFECLWDRSGSVMSWLRRVVALVVMVLVAGMFQVVAVVPSAEAARCKVPSQPAGPAGEALDGAVRVTWALARGVRCPVTGYRVTTVPGGAVVEVGAGESSLVVSGLANGTAYAFTVAARSDAGWSAESDASQLVTPRTVPGVPTGVMGVAGEGSVELSWQPPATDGGAQIEGYEVVVSPGGATAAVGAGTSTRIDGLNNGVGYTFTVAALNAAGVGAGSAPSAVVVPRTVPGVVTSVTAAASVRSAAVQWQAPESDGGSAITGYRVVVWPGGAVHEVGPVTAMSVPGLENGSEYSFGVSAVNVAGVGPVSAASNAVVPLAQAPGPATHVTVVAGALRATVSWSAPVDDGGSPVTGYAVTASPGGASMSVAGSVTSAEVTGLVGGQTYTFVVTASNAVGASASAPSDPVTLASGPSAPVQVQAQAESATSVRVSWQPMNNGFDVSGYVVMVLPGAGLGRCR